MNTLNRKAMIVLFVIVLFVIVMLSACSNDGTLQGVGSDVAKTGSGIVHESLAACLLAAGNDLDKGAVCYTVVLK